MSKLPRILVLSALLGAAPACAWAQQTASQVIASSSTIFQPIGLSKASDLSFGAMVRPSAGSGTVTVDAATGVRNLTGQGGLLNSTATSRALFNVGGEGGQSFSIGVPASMTMTRTGGSETVVATLSPTATSGILSSTLGSSGAASFGVGGAVPVSSSTTSGAYQGSFMVTVDYN